MVFCSGRLTLLTTAITPVVLSPTALNSNALAEAILRRLIPNT
jgi:hypothetical protein